MICTKVFCKLYIYHANLYIRSQCKCETMCARARTRTHLVSVLCLCTIRDTAYVYILLFQTNKIHTLTNIIYKLFILLYSDCLIFKKIKCVQEWCNELYELSILCETYCVSLNKYTQNPTAQTINGIYESFISLINSIVKLKTVTRLGINQKLIFLLLCTISWHLTSCTIPVLTHNERRRHKYLMNLYKKYVSKTNKI